MSYKSEYRLLVFVTAISHRYCRNHVSDHQNWLLNRIVLPVRTYDNTLCSPLSSSVYLDFKTVNKLSLSLFTENLIDCYNSIHLKTLKYIVSIGFKNSRCCPELKTLKIIHINHVLKFLYCLKISQRRAY